MTRDAVANGEVLPVTEGSGLAILIVPQTMRKRAPEAPNPAGRRTDRLRVSLNPNLSACGNMIMSGSWNGNVAVRESARLIACASMTFLSSWNMKLRETEASGT